jgi:UDP-glucose 4-epimerase
MELAGKKVIVTGGAGLVGSHIVDQLVGEKAEVVVYDNFVRGKRENLEWAIANGKVSVVEGDIRDRELLKKTFQGAEYCFHEAAVWLKACQEEPRKTLEINVTGTFNVLETCVGAGIKKLVAASSSSVYGDGLYFPTDEQHPFNNELFYGSGKVCDEQFYRAFKKKYGLDYVAFRYLNIYGPRQPFLGSYTDVIMNFFNKIDENQPPRIEGDGSQTLDLVYVGDCAWANIMAMKSDVSGEVFNVSSGRETTLKKLAETIIKVTGRTDIKPVYVPRDQNLVSRRFGSAKKAKKMLKFEVTTTLEEGLKNIIQWRESVKKRMAK